MKRFFTKYSVKLSGYDWVWFFIWFTLPISIRLNSLAILLGGFVLLVTNFRKPRNITRIPLFHILIPLLFFGLHGFGIANEITGIQSVKELEQMLPFVVIPVFFLISTTSKRVFTEVSISALALSLSVAAVIMLGHSLYQVLFQNAGAESFIYHELIKPFNLGAVYYSFFIIVVLIQFNEISWINSIPWLKYSIVLLLLLMLFLAASKLMIGVGIPILVFIYRNNLVRLFRRRKIIIPFAVMIIILILIPVTMRFNQISVPHFEIINADKYYYNSQLNGLNLRLIQTRFGVEIVNENDAWLNGVGINKSQILLNNKYIEYGIYTGYEGTNDTGYLNYNFHNQFTETFVRSGFAGLVLLILMMIRILVVSRSEKFVSNWVILLIFMFFLTESVLERQQGIVYFCLIYSSYFYKRQNTNTLNEL